MSQDIKIEIATSFFRKLTGLMFEKNIRKDYALFFPNTKRVHSYFMREDITVLYLDENFNILDKELLGPWRKGKKVKQVQHIVELNKEAFEKIKNATKMEIKTNEKYSNNNQ